MDPYDIEDAFSAIEDELIDSMMRNMKRHRVEEVDEGKQWEMWQAMQLRSLEEYKKANRKKFSSKFSDFNDSIDGIITQARKQGNMEQEVKILEAIKDGFKGYNRNNGTMQAEFFRLNTRKLDALTKATRHDLQKAEHAILRMADDQYRKAIFNAQVYANTGAGTYEKAVDMATKDMLSSGLNCVEYKNGARHTLASYAGMALRTASKRAYLTGEGEKRQEWGITTVIMNKRGNPCPLCLPFVGKILIDDVWSGGKASDGPYPLMSSAVAAGLYHPNCKDSHTTYFDGVSTPPDDKFTKKEIADIEKKSKQDAKKQHAKRQEERYGRMARHSLDKDNKKQYENRSKQWNSIANGVDSGIIKSRNISNRNMSNGLRTSPHHILTNDEIASVEKDAREIRIPDGILIFNQGFQTGFSDRDKAIYVRGDILPDNTSSNLRDTLSQKAVLAHEYYGHYKNDPSPFRIGDWRDEFKASYRAAIDAPNLSDEDRGKLMLDAFNRAKEAGVIVKYNKKARRYIYGYDE